MEGLKDAIQNYKIPLILSSTVALTGSCYWLKGQLADLRERRDLSKKRQQKDHERKVQLALNSKFPLTPKLIAITQLSFEQLQNKLATRELSAREVLTAFISKAVAITKEFNCITEFVPQAWEWADEFDKMKEVKGPFHGMPVCIKDNQDIAGMDSTLGMSLCLFKPVPKNEPMVQQLFDLGAIPFCKTNVPQTLLSISSENPIFGKTLNHLNPKLSPGGSSSGSGCLVGAGGAPFGTGTDLGGSLRIPAHFGGICTLKPTMGRICGKGVTPRTVTVAGLAGVNGILAPRAKTLADIYKILIGPIPQLKYDPLIVPLPWDDQEFNSTKTLKIGYFTSLPFFPAMGDTPATVLKAKEVLESLGHTLVPFDLPDPTQICDVYMGLALAEGRWRIHSRLKNDAISPPSQKFFRGKTLPSRMWETVRTLTGFNSARDFKRYAPEKKVIDLWNLLEQQKRIRYAILAKMAHQQLDLLLTPVYPFPACLVDDADILMNALIYTAPWNLVEFPAGTVPFGVESCAKIAEYDDQNNYYFKLAKAGAKNAKNMPIGVQLVGKPFSEEIILRVCVQLDEFKLKENN